MKIALVHDAIDTRGGVETYLQSLIPALQTRGHRIVMVYRRRRTGDAPIARAAECLCIEEHGLDGTVRRLRAWGADVCFSHNMSNVAVDRRFVAEMPVVKMMHGYFGTCISGLKCRAFPSTKACDREFGKECLALYVPRRCGQLNLSRLLSGYRFAREQQRLFGGYARMVVASAHMRDEYVRHGVPPERLHVVPLFSTLGAGGPCASPEPSTVLFAGRMTTPKGGHVLIEAAARANRRLKIPIRLLMAGDGPQRLEWAAQAERAGVPAEFTGWIPQALRADVYRRASVVVVPSLWPEPFGLVGLEAASLGIPAIAFDTGGISAWLRHGRSGVLVDPAAGAEGLSRALAETLADPRRRDAYGSVAIEVARAMSLDAHVSALVDVLRLALTPAVSRHTELVPS